MKEYKDCAKYDSVDEFTKDIVMGLDIEFNYAGQRYCIGGSEIGYFAAKAGENCDDGEDFATVAELLDGYLIAQKTLRELATEIRVTAA